MNFLSFSEKGEYFLNKIFLQFNDNFYPIISQLVRIVYYSIGFTKLALEFGGKLAKLEVGRCLLGAKF